MSEHEDARRREVAPRATGRQKKRAAADPSSDHALLRLQASAGNHATAALLADEVVRRRATSPSAGPDGGDVEPDVERAINAARGGGTPIEPGIRRQMEDGMGADLSDVRLHTGSAATTLNRTLQAKAFAVGGDIFFGGKAPDTSTSAGKHLLAHEVAHTVQQGAAPTVRRETKLNDTQQKQYADLGTMSTYAKKTAKITSVADGGINEALAVLPRNVDGTLTDKAIAAIQTVEKGTWDSQYAIWMDQGIPSPERKSYLFSKEKDAAYLKRIAEAAKKLAGASLNEITDRTTYPELKNLETPNKEADANVTENQTLSGATVTINYNKSDVNAAERLSMIDAAIKKITAAGGKIGNGLLFNLPKYGRKIAMSKDCTSVEVSNFGTRAVFVAPSYVHLSSEIVGNPNEDVEQTQGKDRLKFLSAQLDPGGIASIVHELGHYCHFATSASQFYMLSSSTFADAKAAKLALGVSMYAAGNPREFVAEVFLGLVYGKSFDDETLGMYRGLGGMPIGAAKAVVATTT